LCQILFEVVTRTLVRSLAGLNRLTVRPDLADAAEPFCGTADLHVCKIELGVMTRAPSTTTSPVTATTATTRRWCPSSPGHTRR